MFLAKRKAEVLLQSPVEKFKKEGLIKKIDRLANVASSKILEEQKLWKTELILVLAKK